MKIGIAHGNVMAYDAIGNDVMGMHDTLTACGFEVVLIANRFDPAVAARARIRTVAEAGASRDLSLLIHHHSIHWEEGESLLRTLPVPRVMKYHNVTPPDFFRPYSADHVQHCAAGRHQTARLVQLFGPGDVLTADSRYNAEELKDAGARAVEIVPPFTHVARFARPPRPAPKPPFAALFVGRLAPNKGHFDLLSVISAYVAAFGPDIRLTIAGAHDDYLGRYRAELDEQIAALGIGGNVHIAEQVDGPTLERLFDEASVFLCMSHHEGFCVPVIEAQAAGVPLVSVNATALGETIGRDQLTINPPRSKDDFLYAAHLVHAACTNPDLRRQLIANGYRNVLERFNPAAVADRFMGALGPILERLS